MTRRPLTWLIVLFLLGLVSVLSVGPLVLHAAASPKQELEDIWRRVQQSGVYAFDARVQQTLTPQATLVNAGRERKVTQLHMQGESDIVAETMHLELRA